MHAAHLEIARHALASFPGATVVWLPTGKPGYRKPPVASAADRVAMLRLATAGEPRYRIDERELASGHSGYTVDSLEAMRKESAARLVLVMGADQYRKLDSWHRPDAVRKLAKIAVVARPGAPAPTGATVIPMQEMEVSASDVRARIARGEDVSGLVPAPVLNYIREMGLYH